MGWNRVNKERDGKFLGSGTEFLRFLGPEGIGTLVVGSNNKAVNIVGIY